jgi:hypothetical protein
MILKIIHWLTALLLKFHDSVIQSIYNNFDRQFYYAIANPRSLAGSASKYRRSLQAFALGSLCVRSGSALRSLWVRPSEPRANALGPLRVHFLLGCVRSVLYNYLCFVCDENLHTNGTKLKFSRNISFIHYTTIWQFLSRLSTNFMDSRQVLYL